MHLVWGDNHWRIECHFNVELCFFSMRYIIRKFCVLSRCYLFCKYLWTTAGAKMCRHDDHGVVKCQFTAVSCLFEVYHMFTGVYLQLQCFFIAFFSHFADQVLAQ